MVAGVPVKFPVRTLPTAITFQVGNETVQAQLGRVTGIAMHEQRLLPVWRSLCSVCLRPLLLSWVCRSFEDMSPNQ